jgi:hypothetical protein
VTWPTIDIESNAQSMYREFDREPSSSLRRGHHARHRPRRSFFRSRYLLFIAVAVLIAGVVVVVRLGTSRASGGTTSAGTTSERAAAPIIGIADNNLLGLPAKEQAAQFSAMRSIGITSVRVDANWRLVQYLGPSDFDWRVLDQEVRSIRSAGMSVDLIIDGCPSWAAIPIAKNDMFAQPKSSSEFATYAAEVVTRYRSMGVKYFEVWNEPNINEFWRPRPNPAAYTADLVAAYASIKKVDPAAVVISAGLAPASDNGVNYTPLTFVSDMYQDGVKGSFDYLGIHPYSYPALPDAASPGSAWYSMDESSPSIRSIMIANGDSSKKIWITEFGAPTTGRPGVSPAAQSETLTQALAYVDKTNWVGAFYMYSWRDTTATPTASSSFGLETFDGTPKPSFYAVSAALLHAANLADHSPQGCPGSAESAADEVDGCVREAPAQFRTFIADGSTCRATISPVRWLLPEAWGGDGHACFDTGRTDGRGGRRGRTRSRLTVRRRVRASG